jgi:pimeloyl-ACP methyl ester carboxylesterase
VSATKEAWVPDIEPIRRTVAIGPARLTTATWGDGSPGIVMLHEGLGSIAQWRDVPADLAARSGLTVMAYDRAGHGASTPTPAGPWPADWLHHEATVLAELIGSTGADKPLLVGHSDGGSIALIHAATAGHGLAGVVTLAAHSWVEELCFESIIAMRSDRDRMVAGLTRYHDAASAVFDAWSGVWLSDAFRSWDIRPMLASVVVPTVIAQGLDDPYASTAHATLTAEAVGANATCVLPAGIGHIMHRDDPDLVTNLVLDFIATR